MKTVMFIVMAGIAFMLAAFDIQRPAKSPMYEELMYVGGFKSLDGNEPVFVEVFADKRDSTSAIYGSFRKHSGEKRLYIASGRCIYNASSRSVAGFVMTADVAYGYSGPLEYPY